MTDQQSDYESDIISIVAHDLKSPVSAAKGFLELVEHTGPLTERQEYFVNRAMMALARMEQIIINLLDFSRLESGISLDLAEVDIQKLIDDSLALLGETASQREIKIHVQAEPESTMIVADARLLSHVISNLLSNAIKYNRDGGEVWVRIIRQPTTLRVDVQDNGHGISPENQTKVFERFFREKRGKGVGAAGTGLGLAISHSIIELHSGHIWVESTPGEGSTFSFTLPLKGQEAKSGSARGRGKRLGPLHAVGASEESDAVDDQWQESMEQPETDSKNDEQ